MKTILSFALSILMLPAFGGDIYKLSMKDILLKKPVTDFLILDVIDGRDDKTNIGWVQTGMFNKKKIAQFEKPFSEELLTFLKRNNQPIGNALPVIIKMTSLQVSEQTRAMSETAKAEVVFSIYEQVSDDRYIFIARVYGTAEQGAMDVTSKHPEDISMAFTEAFSQIDLAHYDRTRETAVTRDQMINELQTDEERTLDLPILVTEQYREGVFMTFSEFTSNEPSVTENYEVKEGSKLKLKIVGEDGRSERVKDVFGMVYNGKPYISFHNNFYPLEKKGNTFHFIGPHVPDQNAVTTGALLGGAIGAAIASSASGGQNEYKINMITGQLILVGEVKK